MQHAACNCDRQIDRAALDFLANLSSKAGHLLHHRAETQAIEPHLSFEGDQLLINKSLLSLAYMVQQS